MVRECNALKIRLEGKRFLGENIPLDQVYASGKNLFIPNVMLYLNGHILDKRQLSMGVCWLGLNRQSGGIREGMTPVGQVAAFGWGCCGSIAIEVVLFCNAVRRSRGTQVPLLYRKPAFLLGRSLLVLVAGVL